MPKDTQPWEKEFDERFGRKFSEMQTAYLRDIEFFRGDIKAFIHSVVERDREEQRQLAGQRAANNIAFYNK